MKLNRTLIASMIYITWIIIFAVYNYHQQKTELISVLDKRLEIAARNFTNIIPKNFHHKGMSKNSITKAKDLELVKLFNKYAKTNNIYYIYSMIVQNNKIFFAASNATKEGLKKNNGGYYFYHYDDAGPHIYEAFKNKEPLIVEIKYPDDDNRLKEVYFWNKLTSEWVILPTELISERQVMRAIIHLPYEGGILQPS